MKISEATGRQMFDYVTKSIREGKVSADEAIALFDKWFEAHDFVNTGRFMGWVRRDKIDDMGIYQDDFGNWHHRTELVTYHKKRGNKEVEIMVEEPVKFNQWKEAEIEKRSGGFKQENLRLFKEAKAILGGIEI